MAQVLRDVQPEDLPKFDMIPESSSAACRWSRLWEKLDEVSLVDILARPRNTLAKQYRKLMEMDGVQLKFTDGVLRAVVLPRYRLNLIQDWETAARPLVILDEVRPDGPPGIQYVFFAGVWLDTRRAVEWLQEANRARAELSANDRDRVFKGKNIFNNGEANSKMRTFFFACVRNFDGLSFWGSTNVALRDLGKRTTGGIRTYDLAGKPVLRRGPELLPLMTFLKNIALDHQLADIQMDVLVDRSKQLGFDALSAGLQEGEWQVYGPSTFNTKADGTPSDLQCPTSFRIIAVSEKSWCRDLLLIPDAIAYAGRTTQMFDEAKQILSAGNEVYYRNVGPEHFRQLPNL